MINHCASGSTTVSAISHQRGFSVCSECSSEDVEGMSCPQLYIKIRRKPIKRNPSQADTRLGERSTEFTGIGICMPNLINDLFEMYDFSQLNTSILQRRRHFASAIGNADLLNKLPSNIVSNPPANKQKKLPLPTTYGLTYINNYTNACN